MECSKWENEGLLYYFGDLEGERQKSFKQHLENGCEFCNSRIRELDYEHREFFNDEVLTDEVPEDLDNRIRAGIQGGVKPVVFISPFIEEFLKKTLVPVLLLAAGFGGGFMYAVKTDMGDTAVAGDTQKVHTREMASSTKAAESAAGDSLNKEGASESDTLIEKVRRGESSRIVEVKHSSRK